MTYQNKVIWITGASSGIGAELALQLSKMQARLILSARRADVLTTVTHECLKNTTHCHILPADLFDNENLIPLTVRAIAVYGHVDMVIHSAGNSQRSLAVDTDMSVYRSLMELNFFAPVTITNALLPHFKEQNHGHIVVLSSMSGLMGFPMRTGYAAAKHALKGFFETFQTEDTLPNVYTTIVSPGRIKTPISLSAVKGDGTLHAQMDEGQLNGIPVEECVEKILRGVGKKKKHVIIAREERLLWWIWWFLPGLYYRIAHNKGLK